MRHIPITHDEFIHIWDLRYNSMKQRRRLVWIALVMMPTMIAFAVLAKTVASVIVAIFWFIFGSHHLYRCWRCHKGMGDLMALRMAAEIQGNYTTRLFDEMSEIHHKT